MEKLIEITDPKEMEKFVNLVIIYLLMMDWMNM